MRAVDLAYRFEGGLQLRDSAGFSPASQLPLPKKSGHPDANVKLLDGDCIPERVWSQAE